MLHNLPSASGIEVLGERTFVISDNTDKLYALKNDYSIQDTFHIAGKSNLQAEVLDNEQKSDFEGIASFQQGGKDYLLIFGSGSKGKEREKLIWVTLGDSISFEIHDLAPFYQFIIENSGLDKKDFNLEGVSILDGNLFLLNRGDNVIYEFDLVDFISFLEQGDSVPDFRQYQIKLPIFQHVQAGFSGATALLEEGQIIFTASLENTENWVDDGEVLGSYVGLLDLKSLKNNYEPICYPLKADGKMMKLKVESVEVQSRKDNHYQLILVTDSDGGISELLEVEVSFRE